MRRMSISSAPNFTRPYRRKTTVLLAVALLASLLWTPRPVLAADGGDSSFLDLTSDSGQAHVFATEVEWLASRGITRGCNPPDDNLFCVDEVVTRGQMAAFLNRALRLPEGSKVFADTAGHLFEDDIAALGTAGITRGCNPPDNTLFCPDDPVTRGQMAAFLTRALDLAAGTEVFADTARHHFEADIAALAAAGITRGCNPPDNTLFCPDDPVTRGQMAAFLYRAFATGLLDRTETPDDPETPVPSDPDIPDPSDPDDPLPPDDPGDGDDPIAPLTIDPTDLSAFLGRNFVASFSASGGVPPYTWTATGLPAELSLDPGSGELSGRVLDLGSHTFEVTVTDSQASPRQATAEVSLAVVPLPDCAGVTSIPQLECAALVAFAESTTGATDVWRAPADPCLWVGVTCSGGHVDTISLDYMVLAGTLPEELGWLSELAALSLRGNQLRGSLPPSMGQLSSLVTLDLADNAFDGVIPRELGDLEKLQHLFLGGNQLSGPIPNEIWDLPSLVQLSLSPNRCFTLVPPTDPSVPEGYDPNWDRGCPKINTSPLPTAFVGAEYSATPAVTGGAAPFTWAMSGLPAGLTFDPGTGEISGVPEDGTLGEHSIEVTVTDADGGTDTAELRLQVEPFFTKVEAGTSFTCALAHSGDAYCWGRFDYGRLGIGPGGEDAHTPVLVSGGSKWTDISAGLAHTCGITVDGDAYCWGEGAFGRLGDGTEVRRFVPTKVATNLKFSSISAGNTHTCAIAEDRTAWCWGSNEYGKLGNGDETFRSSPVPVQVDFGGRFRQVVAGDDHTCGLTTGNLVYCWGNDDWGQLGDWDPGGSSAVPARAGITTLFNLWSIDVGRRHSCALLSDNYIICWGHNGDGQAGTGSIDEDEIARPDTVVPNPLYFVEVATGGNHTCAISGASDAYCWGDSGPKLGTEETGDPLPVPHPVVGGLKFETLSAGWYHTCGISVGGGVYCWGEGTHGMLGTGNTEWRYEPTPVAAAAPS